MYCTILLTTSWAHDQHIGQPDGICLVVWRNLSLSYLKLDGKRSTLPAYLGPIPYRQDHTRSDESRPGHRDGDAPVQRMQSGAMVDKSVTLITHNHYSPTFIPPCTARSSAAPIKQHPSIPPQPLHASSHAASHHRRPVKIALHFCKRGLSRPTGHLTTPSATPHASSAHSPDSGVPPKRTHLDSHATKLLPTTLVE